MSWRSVTIRRNVCAVLLGLAAVTVLARCALIPGKVTGGGYVISYTGNGTASFSFNANGCDPTNIKGTFTFQDKTAGVKLSGTITRAGKCVFEDLQESECECPEEIAQSADDGDDLYYAELTYRSTNKSAPGNGTAIACADDNGEGNQADALDVVSFEVLTGPYAGYQIVDDLSGGNVQGHACTKSTATPTRTAVPTNTPTSAPTNTPTDTPTNTPTYTPTYTPTNTPTYTPTDTPTFTPTNTPTDTPTNTPTDTPTNTPTDTPTDTPTPTPTDTPTPVCGDDIVEGDEECDDGNNVSGDCCSADCFNEGFCSIENGTGACQAGSCEVGSCDFGFADCNSDPSDGCEVNTDIDPENCGTCGNGCGPFVSCNSGSCGSIE